MNTSSWVLKLAARRRELRWPAFSLPTIGSRPPAGLMTTTWVACVLCHHRKRCRGHNYGSENGATSIGKQNIERQLFYHPVYLIINEQRMSCCTSYAQRALITIYRMCPKVTLLDVQEFANVTCLLHECRIFIMLLSTSNSTKNARNKRFLAICSGFDDHFFRRLTGLGYARHNMRGIRAWFRAGFSSICRARDMRTSHTNAAARITRILLLATGYY
jgi:hypothetical protein